MTAALLTLMLAIHGVESTYGKDPNCRGNEYQITRVFVDECNRIAKLKHSPLRFTYADRCNRLRSQEMMMVYLSFYGEACTRHFGDKPDLRFYSLVYHLGRYLKREIAEPAMVTAINRLVSPLDPSEYVRNRRKEASDDGGGAQG